MHAEATPRRDFEDRACPFCALACDDLALERTEDGAVRAEVECALARAAFAQQRHDPGARVGGHAVALDAALQAAAERAARSARLLVTGLGVDVAGARAAVRFAQRHCALIDHRASSRVAANQRVFQRRGGITTTYSEARNHGDCFLLVGTDAASANPRFIERIVAPPQALFAPAPARSVLHLGVHDATLARRVAPAKVAAQVEVRGEDLLAALTALGGALRHDAPVDAALAPVVRALRDARYAVVVWDVAALPATHAELIVEAIVDLVAAANLTTRCAGLPLAHDGTLATANQVATWLTGFALPIAFVDGIARHDPARYSAARWLAEGTADVVMTVDAWVGAPRAETAHAQHIVIAPALGPAGVEPDVFIPVAVPGCDAPGHLFRGDGVVALPLRPLAPASGPTVAQVLAGIEARLAAPASA